jgi:RNase H-like domain found in reverse transcriptase
VPNLVVQASKTDNDIPPSEPWGAERVIAYWSRILRPAERNYSSTEREALALKEGLIKFQPYIEGKTI